MASEPLLVRKENEIEFKGHPVFEGVKMRLLLSKDDHSEITVMQARTKNGLAISVPTPEADDGIYSLADKAKLWMEGIGDVELKLGVMV